MCYAIPVLCMMPSLPFEMRFMCSAYHWTNSKLAIVSRVILPCQTQTITLLSLLSSNHHHQRYVSCYEHEMYHLCQYEYDTFSATCQYKKNQRACRLLHYRTHTVSRIKRSPISSATRGNQKLLQLGYKTLHTCCHFLTYSHATSMHIFNFCCQLFMP